MPDHRPHPWRRPAKWIGLVAGIVTAMLTVVTVAFDAGIYRYSSSDTRWICIGGSAINVCRRADPPWLPPAQTEPYWQTTAGASFDWSFTALPSMLSTPSEFSLTLPLWIVTAIITIPTILMFVADRRRPGACPRCNYSLSGLPLGPCPECGAPSTPADAAPSDPSDA